MLYNLVIYTDGSAKGNGKAINSGGWGYVAVTNDDEFVEAVAEKVENTTNNRMELIAIISALEKYGKDESMAIICSDSTYCINTITNWMYSWAANGWKNSSKKTPENLDLVMKLYKMITVDGYKADFIKVQGHSEDIWNDWADKLATGKVSPKDLEEIYGKETI